MAVTDDVDRELKEIQSKLEPLRLRRDVLQQQRRELKSRQFIEANSITRNDVEMSSGDGKPWFGVVAEFVSWMKQSSTAKRFAEWNHRIYFVSDLLDGKMPDEPYGVIDDLPE